MIQITFELNDLDLEVYPEGPNITITQIFDITAERIEEGERDGIVEDFWGAPCATFSVKEV